MVMFNHNIIGKMMINHDKPWNLCIFLPFYHDFPSSIGSIGRPWALGSPSREMASQLEILQLQTSHLKGGAEMERCTYIYDYIYIHILNISIYTQYDIHATCIDNVCIYNVCVYIYAWGTSSSSNDARTRRDMTSWRPPAQFVCCVSVKSMFR